MKILIFPVLYPEPGSNRHSIKELVFETSASTNSAIRAFYQTRGEIRKNVFMLQY